MRYNTLRWSLYAAWSGILGTWPTSPAIRSLPRRWRTSATGTTSSVRPTRADSCLSGPPRPGGCSQSCWSLRPRRPMTWSRRGRRTARSAVSTNSRKEVDRYDEEGAAAQEPHARVQEPRRRGRVLGYPQLRRLLGRAHTSEGPFRQEPVRGHHDSLRPGNARQAAPAGQAEGTGTDDAGPDVDSGAARASQPVAPMAKHDRAPAPSSKEETWRRFKEASARLAEAFRPWVEGWRA